MDKGKRGAPAPHGAGVRFRSAIAKVRYHKGPLSQRSRVDWTGYKLVLVLVLVQ